ncbi:MAG: hypothetical protein WC635_11095 [Bacteriovorax sp.]|jgi:hypothetical protein
MRKKISPDVLLTALALSLFISMSIKRLEAQSAYPTTGTTATGGTIGATPTTSAGTPMGATSGTSVTIPVTGTDTNLKVPSNPTATGGTIGATTIVPPTPEQLSREQGYRPGLEIPTYNPNDCVTVSGRGQLCGAEALNWCRQFPLADNCSIINSNRSY